MQNNIYELEVIIGHHFKDISLLKTALTHSSYANERGCQSYERLEFMGDSILGYVCAEFLYRHEPTLPEGRMTKLRAELVCEQSLHKVAIELGLGAYLRLGKGEENSGGRERVSVLADIVEAIIAAIYIDSGIENAKRFIMERVLNDVEITETRRTTDYKTQLQEFVQRERNHTIEYVLQSESGPDHNKSFTFAVFVNGEKLGEGTGRRKQDAERNAAEQALAALTKS